MPAEDIYRAAVAGMLATLEGDNVEAARATLRKLVGTVPVFVQDGEAYARVGVDPAPLLEAAGIEWIGSGGGIPSLLAAIPLQRRAASKQGGH